MMNFIFTCTPELKMACVGACACDCTPFLAMPRVVKLITADAILLNFL